jgi:hypothetical protein
MQRCVADVTGQGKDLKGAFAVCTAQSQKSGYSEPGSTKQTGKGKAREKQFKKESDMGKKARSYERAVKAGRKAEDMAAVFANLAEGAANFSGHKRGIEVAARIGTILATGGDGQGAKLIQELEHALSYVQKNLAIIDAMYADQPVWKSDDFGYRRKRVEVLDDLVDALGFLEKRASNAQVWLGQLAKNERA